ncbi:MAG: SpoIVB peptidase S55 domain-containing protein [Romboutsia sp.]
MFISRVSSTKSNTNGFKTRFILFTTFLFLVYFFSNNLIYSQAEKKSDGDYLVPMGNVLQIDAQLKHIIVRNTCEDSPFLVGDSILKINKTSIDCYGDFSNVLSTLKPNDKVNVLICRSGNDYSISTTKDILEKINLNSLISGFATLTYIRPETNEFGAVGHPINIGCSKKIFIKKGCISTTQNLTIEKSCKGSVGSINGTKKDTIGEFNQNTNFGIKGKISNLDVSNYKKYKIASLDEVKTGKAHIILQNATGKCEKFEIEILSIENQRSPEPKTFKIRILDKNLMLLTGGIVQGMSGTPIVQGDKIIGAVSHAVENDPSTGYGVFIQWMLNN